MHLTNYHKGSWLVRLVRCPAVVTEVRDSIASFETPRRCYSL